ncbi:hypothetical protein TNCV_602721 [Trichonephila clavipes]|nr:hypothetical protein TNCV_602721 [Trichonephila clavipes]
MYQSDYRRVITWRENELAFLRPMLQKSIDLRAKESLCGEQWNVFDICPVNSQCYRDEILEAYGRFFWML